MATAKKTEKMKKKFEIETDILEQMVDSWNNPSLKFPRINSLEDLRDFQNLLILEIRKPWYKGASRGYDETDPRWRKLTKEDFDICDKCVKNLISILNYLKPEAPLEDVTLRVEKIF